jgi:hypothetical protein
MEFIRQRNLPCGVSNFEQMSRLTNCIYSRGFLHFFLDTIPIVNSLKQYLAEPSMPSFTVHVTVVWAQWFKSRTNWVVTRESYVALGIVSYW